MASLWLGPEDDASDAIPVQAPSSSRPPAPPVPQMQQGNPASQKALWDSHSTSAADGVTSTAESQAMAAKDVPQLATQPPSDTSTTVARPPVPPIPQEPDLALGQEEPDEELGDVPLDDAGNTGRKNKRIFDDHIDRESAAQQHQAGALIRGTLRVSRHRPSTAYVNPDAGSSLRDIIIKGREARNRAVHGDVVYVQVISADGQAEVGEKTNGHGDSKDECDAETSSDDCTSDDDEEQVVFGAPVLLHPAYDAEDEDNFVDDLLRNRKPADNKQPVFGKIVAIADPHGQSRVIVCTLHPNNAKTKHGGALPKASPSDVVGEGDTLIKAKPTDCRMPWILIRINDVTRKALNIPGRLDKYALWPVQILTWSESSSLPLGRLKGRCLGQAGDMEAEVRHALIENELEDHDVDFSDDMLDEVDEIVNAANEEFKTEIDRRLNLQAKRIFTIDPATAKDLDDAIHVDDMRESGQIEVGVHIADVGHFLKMGSLADTEAQRRTTSVYLIDRVLPMLPNGLCNHLCSLNPNEPKLAFSVFFRLDRESGELCNDPKPWFKKSVIRSCCRFNYDEVQDVLDNKEIDRPTIYGDHTWMEITDDLFLLYDVCGKVRDGRLGGGALSISKTKMIFHTRESDDGVPTSYHLESHSASHWIIEELMLLANRCVAQHLAESRLWDQQAAVLRNHQCPDEDKAKGLEDLLKKKLGLAWDGHSAGSLYRSCQQVYQLYGHNLGLCVEMMLMRGGMKQAEYFVYGPPEEESSHHFALNFEYYTHFTSPIRRYPDVMVHRALYALLADNEEGMHREEAARDVVKVCNDKKTKSRRTQEGLDRAIFCVYLRKRKEWFYTVGNVLLMAEDSRSDTVTVTVYCSTLGREKKVCLCAQADISSLQLYTSGVDDKLLLPKTWKFRGKGCLELIWEKDARIPEVQIQTLRMLSSIPVVIIPTDTVPIDFAMFFVSPFHPRYRGVREGLDAKSAAGFEWLEDDDEDGVGVTYNAAAPKRLAGIPLRSRTRNVP